MTSDRDKLEAQRVWRENMQNAWAALRMIREVVEPLRAAARRKPRSDSLSDIRRRFVTAVPLLPQSH